jgi:hypothetical protein
MSNRNTESHFATGPALAALAAAGVGCLVMGVLTILAEASPHYIKPHLSFYDPVGPLSGIALLAVAAYGATWAVLAAFFAGKPVSEKRWLAFAFAAIAAGFIFTFPPFYQLFTVAP